MEFCFPAQSLKRPLHRDHPPTDDALLSLRAKRPRHSDSYTPNSAISLVSQSDLSESPSFTPHQTHHSPSFHYSLSAASPPHHHIYPSSPSFSPSFSPSPQPQPLQPYPEHQFLHHHDWNDDQLVSALCAHLSAVCHRNEQAADTPHTTNSDKYHHFFSQYRQPFHLTFYVTRLVQYSNTSPSAFILALIYLEKVKSVAPQLALTDMNLHRLVSTALVLAIKYLDDQVFSNAYYARVAGVTTAEINQLELSMLTLLNWQLSVSTSTFSAHQHNLLQQLHQCRNNNSSLSSHSIATAV
ncbi:Cyclin-P3-1 [Gracilariopsis chorda]|uniref:Cyclin-P3-1 n=1 Tax=Gracilariopsis chorda TaxID=448386 RepID=A0A2V3IT02_9FLOR|nr:Cyclin-P3-1 [Gracilariopsis chorda]|eukprot:PXF45232.1 Cyclin-P3-1 [Gracilariopsis chorda]